MGCKQTKSMHIIEPRERNYILTAKVHPNYKSTQLENYWHFSAKDNENDMNNMENVSKKLGI